MNFLEMVSLMLMVKNGSIKEKLPVIFSMLKTSGMNSQSKVQKICFPGEKSLNLYYSVFVKEMRVMCDQILSKAADQSTAVDFHELMFKFTLDSFVL